MIEVLDILGLCYADFQRLSAKRLFSGKGLADTIYTKAFATGKLQTTGLGLSAASIRGWEDNFRVGLLEPGRVQEEAGEFGLTIKAVFVLADGAEIECVLIPMPPKPDGRSRSTMCISSQVGCRMGCTFCETGHGGFVRNLTAAEIISQVVSARSRLGWQVGNIVFMGMGEPLDNLDEVGKALLVLTERRGLAFSWERITLCTSGDADKIDQLRRIGHPRLNLSLSLNGADDETRSSLMPVNRKSNLDALATSLAAYPRRRNFVLALNWCLIPGINDSREDARKVALFSRRVGRSIVNLIPYNPGLHPIAAAPTEGEIARFQAWLAEEGCVVKRRASKGRDILAACGQLGGARKAGAATPRSPGSD